MSAMYTLIIMASPDCMCFSLAPNAVVHSIAFLIDGMTSLADARMMGISVLKDVCVCTFGG